MSKLDAVRALREARFEQERSRAAKPAARPKAVPVAPPPAPAAKTARKAQPAESAEPDESLCGHRNISGRACTREKGHAAKTHRYG